MPIGAGILMLIIGAGGFFIWVRKFPHSDYGLFFVLIALGMLITLDNLKPFDLSLSISTFIIGIPLGLGFVCFASPKEKIENMKK